VIELGLLEELPFCQSCELGRLGKEVVVGRGDGSNRLLIVGDNPSHTDELMGRPFEGRAGSQLMRVLRLASIDPAKCRMTLAVKCLPVSTVSSLHIDTCKQWLAKEMEVYRPKVVAALGLVAARAILGVNTKARINALTERAHEFLGVPVCVWYGPSWMLQKGKKTEAETVEFFKKVRGLLGEPVELAPKAA